MPSDACGGVIRLTVPSHPQAVRAALHGLFEGKTLRLLPATDRGTAELVLAEVLNNVVEHAYATGDGDIELTIRVAEGALTCTIVDHGKQMPDRKLPSGTLNDPATFETLPEGGFGWHLIRALASDIDYRRIEDRNELSFRLEREQ